MEGEMTGCLSCGSSRTKQIGGTSPSDTIVTVYNIKSLRMMLRKQTIGDVDGCRRICASVPVMGSDHFRSGTGDSAANGGVTAKQRIRSRGYQILQPAVEFSLDNSFSGVVRHTQPNLECTEQISDPTRHQTLPSPEPRECEGAVHGLHTLNEDGDWLTLSLKFPAKPAVNVVGVGRDDLKLSLDMKAATTMEDFREVQPRDENEVTKSGTVPLVITTAAEDLICGTQPGNSMGSGNGVLPFYYHAPVKEPSFVDQRLRAHIRAKRFHESLTLEPFKSTLALDPCHEADLSDSLFDDHSQPQEKGVSLCYYQQMTESDNFGVEEASVHQTSCVQTGGYSSGIAACSQISRKPMLPTENDRTVMNLLNFHARKIHTAGKRTAMLDKVKDSSFLSSAFVKPKKEASEGQNDPCNPSKNIQLSRPSITLDLNNKPYISGYCLSSRSRGRHAMSEYDSTFPCSLREQIQVFPNNGSPFFEFSGSSGSDKFRHKLAPVLSCQNSTGLLTEPPIMKEECGHLHMEVLLPWQPSDKLDTAGKLESNRSQIEGVGRFEPPLILSNPQNDKANSGKGGHSVRVKISLEAQLLNNSRTQGHFESLRYKELYWNDVACCSSRLPPRQASSPFYTHTKVDNVRNTLGEIAKEVAMEDSDMDGAERISLDSCDCPDIEAVQFDNEGEGERLQVEAERKRTDVKTDGYIHRILGILQDFEELVRTEVRHSRGHFVQSRELQRYSNSSLISCRPPNVFMEPQPNSFKGKWAMLVVEEREADNKKNYLMEAEKCTVTSLTGPDFLEKWEMGYLCDLCNTGSALSLGEWYAWCCGLPASRCWCPKQKKMKKQMAIGFRKTRKLKPQGRNISRHQWSGKVHKMCALWSSEVCIAHSSIGMKEIDSGKWKQSQKCLILVMFLNTQILQQLQKYC